MESEHKKALEAAIEKELKLKRLCGPYPEPIRDGKWFNNAWVSPYFVIPKKSPVGCPRKWRLIHHLSYHTSGDRENSLNGHIDMSKYPTSFPTHLTGAHMIFCRSPKGSVLLGRDIRDYYRNFILNPHS